MSVLVPCTSCSRHVRSAEAACPFCGHALPTNLASRAVPSTGRRMDRLATFTFAVGLTVAACGGVAGEGVDPQGQTQADDEESELRKKKKKDAGAVAQDAGCTEDNFGGVGALYGAPPTPEDDFGGVGALYGAPPTPVPSPCAKDAGAPKDAGKADAAAKDGGRAKDSGAIQPMYGMPPVWTDDGGGIQPMYGLPPTPEDDAGAIQPMYGLPPTPEDDVDGGGFHAMYGLPPTP